MDPCDEINANPKKTYLHTPAPLLQHLLLYTVTQTCDAAQQAQPPVSAPQQHLFGIWLARAGTPK